MHSLSANSVPPSPGGGGHRRPSAAVLGTENADAKRRLSSVASRGGVKVNAGEICCNTATPPRPPSLRFGGRPSPSRGGWHRVCGKVIHECIASLRRPLLRRLRLIRQIELG